MFLKVVKGGRLNSRTPNTSRELSVNLVDLSVLTFLTFLTAGPKCVDTCHETKSRRFVCFNFVFNINAQIV